MNNQQITPIGPHVDMHRMPIGIPFGLGTITGSLIPQLTILGNVCLPIYHRIIYVVIFNNYHTMDNYHRTFHFSQDKKSNLELISPFESGWISHQIGAFLPLMDERKRSRDSFHRVRLRESG